ELDKSRKRMIGVLLLLTVLLDSSFCLSERGRIALTKAYGGIDIDKRHERLKNLGLRSLGPKAKSEMTPKPSEGKTGGSTLADEGTIEEVNQREGVDEFLFNGDMILTDEQLVAFENGLGNQTRQKRQVATYATRWTNNKVFYYFDASITTANQAYVRKQLKYLSDRTCITFVEDATASNRIKVFDGAGCYSSVGMKGGEQSLSLTNGCFVVGTVAHEFMHALGALHMQMRHDRDTYIRIDLTNVPADKQHNFNKETKTINNTPYEYGSNMQYASNAFATTGDSMIPLTAGYSRTLGSQVISFYDVRMINWFYKCNAPCNGLTTTAKCVNGGVPNPRACTTCICPNGYGGTLCGQRKAGCGATFAAGTAWKSRNITVGSTATTTIRDTYTMCNDWITAPAGKKIQIRVTALKNVQCQNGCFRNAIEPKILADKAMTSPRICCSGQLNQIRASNINPTPVVTYSLYYASTFTYQYRYV
uniref:Zinc metalloproteinase n=1 Tax=Haemonchus contortus TaxID=6289 RepID=A0A912MKL3_HAECO